MLRGMLERREIIFVSGYNTEKEKVVFITE